MGRGGGGRMGGGMSRGGGFGGSRSFGSHSSGSGLGRGGFSSSKPRSTGSFSGGRNSSSFNHSRPSNNFGNYGSSPFSSGSRPRPVRKQPVIFINPTPVYKTTMDDNNFGNTEPREKKNWKERGPRIPIGCFSVMVMMVLLITMACVVFGGIWSYMFGAQKGDSDVTLSTKAREPLSKDAVTVDVGYYTDELGWISNKSTLTDGMKYFYEKTGVMPYLWITDTIHGEVEPKSNDFSNFANETYEELFKDRNGNIDEAHLLLIFHEYYSGEYTTYYIAGRTAQAVIDDEGGEILLDYLDRYYSDSSLSDEEFFSKAFRSAADSLMKVTRPNWYYPAILAIAMGIFFIAFAILKARSAAKKEQAELDKQILNTPLEQFGSREAEDLAKKYQDSSK